MSNETKADEGTGSAAAGSSEEPAAPAAAAMPVAPERRDEEGLPLDRKPTLDDVRGSEGSGRTTAVSCTVAVLLLVLGFWVLRALVMR